MQSHILIEFSAQLPVLAAQIPESIHTLMGAVSDAILGVANQPNPGKGEAPPGSGKFLLILKWATWIATGICVLGIMIAGGTMAVSARRGEGGEHLSRLGWVFAGSIVIGSAFGLVNALL